MSRSGYSEDCENLNLWRGSVARAIQGKRGQAFLRDMLAALDALPVKELIAEELEVGPQVCGIGSVGRMRGVDMTGLDPENHTYLGRIFNIAPTLVQEIEFVNDDDFAAKIETPAERFIRVRKWVVEHIK